MYGEMMGNSRGQSHGLRRGGLQLCVLSSKHEVDDTPAEASHSQGCWEGVSSEVCLW